MATTGLKPSALDAGAWARGRSAVWHKGLFHAVRNRQGVGTRPSMDPEPPMYPAKTAKPNWQTRPTNQARSSESGERHLLRRIHLAGKSLNKETKICGGVRLSEVNFKTMESRICPRLYFAGELLDVDGLTGAFNFQAAWTTRLDCRK